ncbi:MAG: exodeoxyribonuclease VII large subunit [Pseudomonadales bacterium]|nr:exodeoxyribonuclease VII large subunit [Pseudomonadales bacterium]
MQDDDRQILSISELNELAKDLLENRFPRIWVEGEISNAAFPASGHIYFTLKDNNAQIRAAMFKGRNRQLKFQPQNGNQVMVRGRVTLYSQRGDYQLIVDQMQEAGEGALLRAYEKLKAKLNQQGWFNEDIKQTLPTLPNQIGVITSPTGAAIRDIISVLKRRFPSIPIIIYPTRVQGEGAADEIARAINKANEMQDCDVLIVGRGGGSLEDLWAFNEESVARAVYDSRIPIVSAVGHQTDVTIIDFVADLRAATPSAAAELLSPDREEWFNTFSGYRQHLLRQMELQITQHKLVLEHLQKRLKHPGRRLEELAQHLDNLETRLSQGMKQSLIVNNNRLALSKATLLLHDPRHSISQQLEYTQSLSKRLSVALKNAMQSQHMRFTSLTQRLNSVSPLATLQRGYSITKTEKGHLLKSANQVKQGDNINTQLQSGSLVSTIVRVSSDD